jgi:hypothetical protein
MFFFSLRPVLKTVCAVAMVGGLLAPLAARATDQLDLSTGLKTLFLMNDKITGTAKVAVVFDPASPESRSDAEAIKDNINSGSGLSGDLKLVAQMVTVSDFAAATDARVAFLARDIPASSFDVIGRKAAAAGMLTMSTDLSCVKANQCVLGIVSKPRVEVYFSPVAANAAHIGFAAALIMLVKQVSVAGDLP